MRSAFLIVERRCAMAIVSTGFHEAFQGFLYQAFAFGVEGRGRFVQYQDSGFFRMARAMEMRWRWPPESLHPLSPMLVSYPSSLSMINSWALATFAAATTSSIVALSTPKVMLL